jgi:uncharacterized protein YybS (DUF2232 family)
MLKASAGIGTGNKAGSNHCAFTLCRRNGILAFFEIAAQGERIVPQLRQGEVPKNILTGIAITCLIFAISVYMPIFGFFCSLFIPLPILFYRIKLGRKTGLIIPIVTTFIMVTIFGKFSIDLLFFMELMFLGFTLGELLEIDLTIDKTVLYACTAVFIIGLAGLFFYSQTVHRGMVVLASEYVDKNLQLTLALYENMGVSEENIQMISDSLPHIQYVLVRIIPSLVFASTLFVSWTNLLMARTILRAKGIVFPEFGLLKQWRPPEILVWGVIGCGLVLLIPNGSLKLVGLNGLITLLTVYFFSGIAIVSYFFEKKRFPRILRLFLYSMIGLQQFILLVVIGLGFFDVWLNFRKLELEKPKKND